MTQPRFALLTAAAGFVLALSAPADAYVVVIGNELAHDCYIVAKTGVDLKGGIATCTAALENSALTPHDQAGTYVNRGTIEIAQKNFEAAMADYNKGIQIMPTLGDAYIDRSGAYVYTKQWALAIADANKGLELNPTLPFAGYYNRAVAEHLSGDLQHAYFDYQKVLELEPRFTPASEMLKGFVVTRKPNQPTMAGQTDPNAPVPANGARQPDANAPTLANGDTSAVGTRLAGN